MESNNHPAASLFQLWLDASAYRSLLYASLLLLELNEAEPPDVL